MGEYRLKMPDVGEGVVEAEIVEWKIAEGDMVEEDQDLVDVMTDKATVEIPAPVSGKVVKRVGAAGDMIPVGEEILVIETEEGAAAKDDAPAEEAEAEPSKTEAKAPEPAPKPTADPKPAKKPAPQPAAAAPAQGLALRTSGGKALASPAVRKRALEADVDLSAVPGTGPAGRVTREDLDDFLAAGGRLAAKSSGGGGGGLAPRTAVNETKVIGLRRKIAMNMQAAWADIPHITYVEEVDVTALESLRAHLNAKKAADRPKLTFLPFLAAAMAKAVLDFPHTNAHYDSEAGTLTEFAAAHIGIATATEKGLMVPVLRHAEAMDLWTQAAEIKRLSEACRDGKAARDELSGSSISITSLGAVGGLVTTPIINKPETAIVGVNKIVERPAFDAGGRVVPRKFMNLSSSFDHRIVDGYDAALFVQRIKGLLEEPATLFMEGA